MLILQDWLSKTDIALTGWFKTRWFKNGLSKCEKQFS